MFARVRLYRTSLMVLFVEDANDAVCLGRALGQDDGGDGLIEFCVRVYSTYLRLDIGHCLVLSAWQKSVCIYLTLVS